MIAGIHVLGNTQTHTQNDWHIASN